MKHEERHVVNTTCLYGPSARIRWRSLRNASNSSGFIRCRMMSRVIDSSSPIYGQSVRGLTFVIMGGGRFDLFLSFPNAITSVIWF